MSMEKLKPCPFCGEMPKLREVPSMASWVIYCDSDSCGVRSETRPADTKAEVIAAWNRRDEGRDAG